MKIKQITMLLFTVAIILAACSNDTSDAHVIAPFSFVNQYGEPYGSEQLEGSIWIANFMFTNCTSVCPTTAIEMAKIQKELANKGLDVELVSFSVDPEIDSPERLKIYVDTYTNDDSNWHLLTGYSQKEIEIFANEQFHTIVQKPDNSDQIIHGSSFYLIDQKGRVINKYHYSNNNYIEEMIAEIEKIK